MKKYFHKLKYYGVAYFISANYRRLIQDEINRKDAARDKAKYGSGFLSSKPYIKHQLIVRDGSRCLNCKVEFNPGALTIDHIKPVSQGGTNKLPNLRLLCGECHVKITREHNKRLGEVQKIRQGWIDAGILKPLPPTSE